MPLGVSSSHLRINLIRGRGGIVLSIYAIATPYLLNV